MKTSRPGVLGIGLALAGLVALAGPRALGAQPRAERSSTPGYLASGGLPDEGVYLPPPPADGSRAGKTDVATFKATRALAGSPRWTIAAEDASFTTPALMKDFSCALGATVDPATSPTMARLSSRAVSDAVRLVQLSRDRFKRPRPYAKLKGKLCVAVTDTGASGSYPSGHAAVGWIYGLILAELAPDHAAQVLARGRAYGESRVVCGVHYVSDIEAGRITASALFATLHANREFQADMAAARAELAALPASARTPADPQACAAESATLFARPW